MVNTDTKEITFTIDTKKNRYYFGYRNNINNYSCYFIGKELKK